MLKTLKATLDEREKQGEAAAAELMEERDHQDVEMVRLVAKRRSAGRKHSASSWLFIAACDFALEDGADPKTLVDALATCIRDQGDEA